MGTRIQDKSRTAKRVQAVANFDQSTGVVTYVSGKPTRTDEKGFPATAGSDTTRVRVTTSPIITTTALNAAQEGVPFSQQLIASGTQPITWGLDAGSLPGGLVLGATGLITGTPTTAGAYNFTVEATNAAGSDTQQYTGTVLGGT
jgi:hypothetical protein